MSGESEEEEVNDLQRKQLENPGGGPGCNLWIIRSSEDGISMQWKDTSRPGIITRRSSAIR